MESLYGCAALQSGVGKFIIAINDDIDPNNGDAVFGHWATVAIQLSIATFLITKVTGRDRR